MEYAIDIKNMSKKFGGNTVVDNISIKIPRGKIYGFLGPNGSGKTTSIRMLCGLLTPDSGEGTCLGFDFRTQSEQIKLKTGYMTQKFSFWEDLTIRENLEFVAEVFGLNNRKERVLRALKDLNLEKRADQLAGALSGGWKQRLALAACILHEPEILLLDEPTAGVDPKARREFWDELHQLASRGITILVSTHYMDEAERCHAIIYIAYGNIIAQGTVEDVIAGSKLVTWVAEGKDTNKLINELQHDPAVAAIAPFGDSLHISSTDEAALLKAIEPHRHGNEFTWHRSSTSLEDTFIYYMNTAGLGENQ